MVIADLSLSGFLEDIKDIGTGIVIYGAGVIGKMTVPYWISSEGLEDKVLSFVDADIHKHGTEITIGSRKVEILAPESMENLEQPFVILVTGSRYQGILDYLGECKYLKDVKVYLFAEMLLKKTERSKDKLLINKSDGIRIPKVINYCWFGGGQMPDIAKRCIDSWHKYCPDYDYKCWDEKNYDISKYQITVDATRTGKWAFLTDVVKLDVLYKNGGIYLDVELTKSLDELLYLEGFCCAEKWGVVNLGGGSGMSPKMGIVKEMLECRLKSPLVYPDGRMNTESSGLYETEPLVKKGFIPDNSLQKIDGLTILPFDYFHPYDYMSKETIKSDNTYGIHHFWGSWLK